MKLIQGGKRADAPKTARQAVYEILDRASAELDAVASLYGERWVTRVAVATRKAAEIFGADA